MKSDGRRYHVLEAVGRGGFGTVYKAEHIGPGGFTKRVALKILNPDVSHQTGFGQRLRDEARMLGLINHRSIVQVDGLLLLNGNWTIVMEYVSGVDLKALLQEGPVPVGPAIEIVQEVASALAVAYDHPTAGNAPLKLLHRDIKPSNIKLTGAGEVKVLDFGVARADFGARESETEDVHFGSMGYMAPERFDGIDNHTSDVYSLGSVLIELILGEALGKTSGNRKRHKQHIKAALTRVWQVAPNEPLFYLLANCLAYDAEQRPTAKELDRSLRNLRLSFPKPWLADWSNEVVPPLEARLESIADNLTGSMLEEDLGITTDLPTQSTMYGANERPKNSTTQSRQLQTHMAEAFAAMVSACIVMLVGGGLVSGAWWFTRGPGAVTPPPVATPPTAPSQQTVAPVLPSLPEQDQTWDTAVPTTTPAVPQARTSTPRSTPSTSRTAPEAPPQPRTTPPPDTRAEPPAPQRQEPAGMGRVRLRGNAEHVRLISGRGSFGPGQVPAGAYTIQATFRGQDPRSAGTVRVAADETVTIHCKAALRRCIRR